MIWNGIYTKPNGLAPYLPMEKDGTHGYAHWERVCQNGLTMARINGADPVVVSLFAWLHDARRENDHHDPEHGRRAVRLAVDLQGVAFDLESRQYSDLLYALKYHDKGFITENVTTGTCWDADRLDLLRVGTLPDPRLMSTDAGKALAHQLRKRVNEHVK